MAKPRRRNAIIAAVIVIIVILLLLLRCTPQKPVTQPEAATPSPAPASTPAPAAGEPAPSPQQPDEVLTAATIETPHEVGAGAAFSVAWTGPDNEGDYITIVPTGAKDAEHATYELTRRGSPLRLTAPIDAGDCEVRYVTARSHTVLGRAAVRVVAGEATLDAAASVPLDTPLSIAWTGPDNKGDYITIVAAGTPDGRFGAYTTTDRGSPLKVRAPVEEGPGEIRYITGQGARTLARRPVLIVMPDVSLDAPARAVAGSVVPVAWTGPGNDGDYITVVPAGTPDGKYNNYVTLARMATAGLTMPIDPGTCELRYMTGRGARFLARRPIEVFPAAITLDAPATTAAGSEVSITWTGPDNSGDYITIVSAGAAEGTYQDYAITRSGTPAKVKAPTEAGACEIRYISGQGKRTLARRAIQVGE